MNTPNLDWANLPFAYQKSKYNVRCYYRNGKWGELEVSSSDTVTLHMAATSLHYGQQAFEGLKAFRGEDDKIRVFRWEENAKRMQNSADGILMPQVPTELFGEAMKKVIELNQELVPPYGTGASLYLRPLLIGDGAKVGVSPADEYLFMIFVTPVGPYFKEGFKPVNFLIARDFDRAAPKGTGKIKVGGNYAASLNAMKKAHDEGFANVLFLDAREKEYIDECGPANFFAIKKEENKTSYITPASESILPSITNMSLKQIAKDMGLTVESRPVHVNELADFQEAGACGTAAVISPIGKIVDENGSEYVFSEDGKPGEVSTKLYEKLTGIQNGKEADPHGWVTIIE